MCYRRRLARAGTGTHGLLRAKASPGAIAGHSRPAASNRRGDSCSIPCGLPPARRGDRGSTARQADSVNDWVVIARRFNGPPNSANGGYTVDWWARRSRRHRSVCRCVNRRRWSRYCAGAKMTALFRCSTAMTSSPRVRPRRTGARAASADGRGGRDRDAEVRGLRAPQVPDVFCLRDGARGRLRIYAGQVGDGQLIASPWTPQSDIRCLCGRCSTAQARTRSRLSNHRTQIVVLGLAHRRAPSARRARGSGTSSPRGRWAVRGGSTSRLLRSTTRRGASSPSPTPSGSSCDPAAFGR